MWLLHSTTNTLPILGCIDVINTVFRNETKCQLPTHLKVANENMHRNSTINLSDMSNEMLKEKIKIGTQS